jgi:hypothetical protein
MKKGISKNRRSDGDMLPEYDFRGGVRGKHYSASRRGHTAVIHKEDGSTVIQHFSIDSNAIILEPDVRRYFANSKAVNEALRSLIKLIPQKPGKGVKRVRKVG